MYIILDVVYNSVAGVACLGKADLRLGFKWESARTLKTKMVVIM
jgi:hypothetical protein